MGAVLEYYRILICILRSLERPENEISTREGPETDCLENPTAEERTASDIPNQDYTSKGKAQGKVAKYLSGGNLVATLYAVKWMFTVVSGRTGHVW